MNTFSDTPDKIPVSLLCHLWNRNSLEFSRINYWLISLSTIFLKITKDGLGLVVNWTLQISGKIDQRVPKLWSASSAKLLDPQLPSFLASPGTGGHYGLRRVHWFGLHLITHTIVWPYWNLTVGGRQYQCSHFLPLLSNNYCRHKTETTLHYSHILSLYC